MTDKVAQLHYELIVEAQKKTKEQVKTVHRAADDFILNRQETIRQLEADIAKAKEAKTKVDSLYAMGEMNENEMVKLVHSMQDYGNHAVTRHLEAYKRTFNLVRE